MTLQFRIIATDSKYMIAITDTVDALRQFEDTGDRSKFREWLEKYKDLIDSIKETKKLGKD